MKYLTLSIVLIILLCATSCKKKQDTPSGTSAIYKETIDTLHIEKPSNLKPKVRLTSQAKEGVQDWNLYKDLTKAIDSLPSQTLGGLKKNLKQFEILYKEEKEAKEEDEGGIPITPPEVQTNSVNARLIAIQTRANALENEVSRNTPNSKMLATQIGLLQNAYQDLNLQLNEIYTTSVKDLLEEIKEENRLKNIESETNATSETPLLED